MFDCRVEMDGREVASARVSVFEPGDGFSFAQLGERA